MANKTKLILGLVGAAAAGVVVGLLLAPQKGTATRKKLKKTATNWADHLTDLFSSAKGEIENLKKKVNKAAGDASHNVRNVKESHS